MPAKTTPPSERSVTRTYRTAIKLGDDFITIEETITLPLDASPEDVQRAVDLGWRIFQQQRDAVEQQIAQIREQHPTSTPITVRDPDAPASERQRNFIASLQQTLGWSNEQLAAFAHQLGYDLVSLSKGQASAFIDELRRQQEEQQRLAVAEERARYAHQPINDRQRNAITNLARELALDTNAEIQRRFNASLDQLTNEQAAILINEWQAMQRASRDTRR
ncbi:MAG: hypothetical protein KatS3mg055_3347 [Chloroflexus sp.]|jgi:hypothetical protein|uniref:hypothetical protein n=1 Tax=Chloroflexus sp. TaxID=1904827 RepID=UPI000F1FB44B|nr:hypothetical protein [Chloroflexus sp.]RMG51387.1 MAG: hypothetical protein D6716_05990 [Chloroflexota bacterium]GIV90829.1 MAG: hypothetical protein KatS3mg055_3347 [Chloroflexus sp.]